MQEYMITCKAESCERLRRVEFIIRKLNGDKADIKAQRKFGKYTSFFPPFNGDICAIRKFSDWRLYKIIDSETMEVIAVR